MARAPSPPVSDAAMVRILEELRRIDPGQSARHHALSREANVETLHQVTGLARGTVHNAITRLDPVLRSKAHRDSALRGRRGGKPTILYRLSPRAGEALVLDFNHDRVTAWRADSLGNVFDLGDERVEVDRDAESAIAIGARLLRKLPSADWQNVVGIGLSIPAPVDPDTHRTLGHVLRSWENIDDLEGILHKQLRVQMAGRTIPIVADNDANLASLAEYRSLESRRPSDKDLSNLLLVKMVPGRIGVGAGAIINGQQLRGRGLAMELGHLSIDTPVRSGANVVECPHCKHTNCLQARISTDALIGGVQAPAWDDVVRWTREDLLSLHGARNSAEEANDLDEVERIDARLHALASDIRTRAIITAGEEMGRALAKVATLVDPDVIALEGELARAWLDPSAGSVSEIVGDPLNETFLACSPFSRAEPVVPTLAQAASNCARGAAAAVLDKHLNDFILDRV